MYNHRRNNAVCLTFFASAAALESYTAAQKSGIPVAASAGAAATATSAAALLKEYEEADKRIEEEEARVENAVESEDKRKLKELLKPGALPNLQKYKPEEVKVESNGTRIRDGRIGRIRAQLRRGPFETD